MKHNSSPQRHRRHHNPNNTPNSIPPRTPTNRSHSSIRRRRRRTSSISLRLCRRRSRASRRQVRLVVHHRDHGDIRHSREPARHVTVPIQRFRPHLVGGGDGRIIDRSVCMTAMSVCHGCLAVLVVEARVDITTSRRLVVRCEGVATAEGVGNEGAGQVC